MSEAGEAAATTNGDLPELLYHYTGVEGLLGILQQKSIRATDYRYLNDSSEIRFGARLYEQAVEERIPKSSDDLSLEEPAASNCQSSHHRSMLRHFLIEVLKFEGALIPYMASFSEPLPGPGYGDDLSQWRAYSKGPSGFALGFDLRGIPELEKPEPNNPRPLVDLVQCKYYSSAEANPFLDIVYELIKSHNPDNLLGTLDKLGPVIVQLVGTKHPAFSAEREWRLVVLAQPGYHGLEIRPGKAGPVPFLSYHLGFEAGGLLPLRRVVVGPASKSSLGVAGVDSLLHSLGYKNTEVVPSEIPYRDW